MNCLYLHCLRVLEVEAWTPGQGGINFGGNELKQTMYANRRKIKLPDELVLVVGMEAVSNQIKIITMILTRMRKKKRMMKKMVQYLV